MSRSRVHFSPDDEFVDPSLSLVLHVSFPESKLNQKFHLNRTSIATHHTVLATKGQFYQHVYEQLLLKQVPKAQKAA